MTRIPMPVRGRRLTARYLGRMVDRLNHLRFSGQEGVTVLDTPSGVSIGVGNEFDVLVPVVLTRVAGLAVDVPDEIFYRVRGWRRPGIDLPSRRPDYARIASGVEVRIRAAADGDRGYLIRQRDAAGAPVTRLWAPTERLSFAQCAQQQRTGPGGFDLVALARAVAPIVAAIGDGVLPEVEAAGGCACGGSGGGGGTDGRCGCGG